MKDRFKFRAWDASGKKMFYHYDVAAFDGCGHLVLHDCPDTNDTALDEVMEHTMQSTGLKDKNGKLIYEGDIMEGYCGRAIIQWGEDVGMGFGFMWEHVASGETLESITGFISDYEIIGNLYENPELLT